MRHIFLFFLLATFFGSFSSFSTAKECTIPDEASPTETIILERLCDIESHLKVLSTVHEPVASEPLEGSETTVVLPLPIPNTDFAKVILGGTRSADSNPNIKCPVCETAPGSTACWMCKQGNPLPTGDPENPSGTPCDRLDITQQAACHQFPELFLEKNSDMTWRFFENISPPSDSVAPIGQPQVVEGQ